MPEVQIAILVSLDELAVLDIAMHSASRISMEDQFPGIGAKIAAMSQKLCAGFGELYKSAVSHQQ